MCECVCLCAVFSTAVTSASCSQLHVFQPQQQPPVDWSHGRNDQTLWYVPSGAGCMCCRICTGQVFFISSRSYSITPFCLKKQICHPTEITNFYNNSNHNFMCYFLCWCVEQMCSSRSVCVRGEPTLARCSTSSSAQTRPPSTAWAATAPSASGASTSLEPRSRHSQISRL